MQREIIERNPSDRVVIIGKMDFSVFIFSAEAAAHLSNRCLLEYSSVVIDFHERCVMEFEPEISVFRPDRPGIRKVLGDLRS